VKVNVAEVLRAELARRSWEGEPVAIGAATDPYQPAEGRYRLTRRCIEALSDATNAFHIITRGPLIVRDAALLAEASARADVSVTFSVPTVDDDVWRTTEPGTAPPRQRLRALKTLVDAGVRASVGMAPLLPGLSDHPSSIERVVVAAREAGACGIWANLLYLRAGTREHFLSCLARDWPELLPDYERLYARGAYLPQAESRPAKEEVRRLANVHEVRDRRAVKLRPPERDEQLSLLST
jgi:DNA repair photolyase